jgi:hypothetical protein
MEAQADAERPAASQSIAAADTPPDATANRVSPHSRRLLIGGASVLLIIAVAAWWWMRDDSFQPLRNAPQEGASQDQESFAAAIAYLIQSGGDTIRLDQDQITDTEIQTLSEVERLRVIRIDRGELTPIGGRSLASMPHLEQLHLRHVDIDDATLDAIAQSQSLWLLNLSSVKASSDAVERLATMPRLRQLRLVIAGGHNSYASAVAAIRRLRSVHLVGVRVTNEGLKSLASLPYLESLYLDDTIITDDGWMWLFENQPQLHVHVDQKHHDRDPQRH